MKAIVYSQYGPPDVLQLKEVGKPIPGENDVLIRVRATAVTFSDLRVRDFTFSPRDFWLPMLLWPFARMSFGVRKPRRRILGSELAGEIETVGPNVTLFAEGDQVFGTTEANLGAYAEYVCMSETKVLAEKPEAMSFEEAAPVPHGAITASHFINKENISPGDRVLINGASGGIGQFAVQLAKHYGAEVTGVCGAPRMEWVRSLGADEVIDYREEDFTKNGQTYEVIFDTAVLTSYSRCRESLSPSGRYLLAVFGTRELLQMLVSARRGGRKVICGLAPINKERLHSVRDLIDAGKIRTEIDRLYPLEQTAEAHRYVESGQKRANVIITIPV